MNLPTLIQSVETTGPTVVPSPEAGAATYVPASLSPGLRKRYNQFCEAMGAQWAPATRNSYDGTFDRFSRWCVRKGLTLGAIKSAHIGAFLNGLKAEGLSNSTVTGHKTKLLYWFAWLLDQGIVDWHVKRTQLPRFNKQHSERNHFTRPQFERLLKRLELPRSSRRDWWPEYLGPAICIGYHTGLRLGDVANLQWPAVNLDDNSIDVEPHKTRRFAKRVLIPICPELREVLLTLWNTSKDQTGFVLQRMASLYALSPSDLSKEFVELCVKSGLPNHSFHSFRHGFVTRLLNAGVNADTIGLMTGQSSAIIRTYAHVSLESRMDAVTKANLLEETRTTNLPNQNEDTERTDTIRTPSLVQTAGA